MRSNVEANPRTGLLATILFYVGIPWPIIGIFIVTWGAKPDINSWWLSLSANEWGDLFAGLAGPSALCLLAASFLLQKEELRRTTNALFEQKDQMVLSNRESEIQNQIIRNQYAINAFQIYITQWKFVVDQIKSSVVLAMNGDRVKEGNEYEFSILRLRDTLSDCSPDLQSFPYA